MSLIIIGARVILACRDVEKGNRAKKSIIAHCEHENSNGDEEIIVKHLDLSSMRSVRQCAQELLKEEEYIHILVNNAGKSN